MIHDEDIEPAQAAHDVRHDPFRDVWIAQVTTDGIRTWIALAVADDHPGPGALQQQRRRAPNTPSSTGDERALPGEVDHPRSRSSTRSQITCSIARCSS